MRTQPGTGRHRLFSNQQAFDGVPGWSDDDGRALLGELLELVGTPDFRCRLRWAPGTVVLRDNRCTQHEVASDDEPAWRRMERVAVRGDRPG